MLFVGSMGKRKEGGGSIVVRVSFGVSPWKAIRKEWDLLEFQGGNRRRVRF